MYIDLQYSALQQQNPWQEFSQGRAAKLLAHIGRRLNLRIVSSANRAISLYRPYERKSYLRQNWFTKLFTTWARPLAGQHDRREFSPSLEDTLELHKIVQPSDGFVD